MVSLLFCFVFSLALQGPIRYFKSVVRVNLGKEVSYFFTVVKFWISKISEDWDLVGYQKEDPFIDVLLQATNGLPQLSVST